MAKRGSSTVGRRPAVVAREVEDDEDQVVEEQVEEDEDEEIVMPELLEREDNVEEAENNSPEARNVVISLDSSVQEVLSLNKDSGVNLVFDHKSFLELPEDVIKELRYKNRDNYFLARGALIALQKAPARKKRTLIDPLTNELTARLNKVENKHYNKTERRWFHQAWIDPKFVDSFKGKGYRNVRQNTEGEDDQSGNIVQLLNGDSVELVALEVPYQVYEDHLHAMSERSRSAYTASKDTVKDTASRRYGVTVYDEENAEEREYMDYMVKKAQQAV